MICNRFALSVKQVSAAPRNKPHERGLWLWIQFIALIVIYTIQAMQWLCIDEDGPIRFSTTLHATLLHQHFRIGICAVVGQAADEEQGCLPCPEAA